MQKYKSNITTTSGAAVRNVPVHVLTEGGTPAALFLDRAGTVTAPNPLITAADGTFYFYAVNGRYSLRTTVEGASITDADVVLLMDPEEITVAGPIAEAVERSEAAAQRAEAAVEDSGIPELVDAAQNAIVDANQAVEQAYQVAGVVESARQQVVVVADKFGDADGAIAAAEAAEAAAQSSAAQASALEASAQAAKNQAEASQILAEQAKAQAEAARDGAVTGAELYPNEAAGRAAVTDGQTFNVQGAGDVAAFQYRRITAASSNLIATFPAAAAVATIGRKSSAASALSLDRLLSAQYAHAIVDGGRRVVEGVPRVQPGGPLTARNVFAVVVDGAVIAAIERNGSFVNAVPLQLIGTHAGRGRGDARAIVDGVVVDAVLGDVLEHRCSGTSAEVVRDSQAGPAVTTVELLPESRVAAEVTEFQHALGYGQSLSLGGGAEPVATTSPPSSTRLFSPAFGVRLDVQSGVVGVVTPLKPLQANSTEVPIVQAAAQLLRTRGLPRNRALCASAHGLGGASIGQLQKGSTPYVNLLKTFTDVRADVIARGFAYRPPVIDMIQGESDYSSSAAAWTSSINQLRADLLSDFAAVDSSISRVPMVLDQVSNWTAFNAANSAIPFAQLALALSDPLKVYCAGPKYWLPTIADGVHLTPLSSSLLGCMHAPALQAATNGATWLPVHAVAARRAGKVIDVEFHIPFGVLTVDIQAISAPENWGLRFVDSANSAAIESVQLLGRNRVRCTLNAAPTGDSPYIGIADTGVAGAAGGPTAGPRSCLRDSVAHEMYGHPVYFFACHQRISVE